ncbi:MAG TPA: RNA polymerase sigma factor [Bacteroidales bacterium]|nr:RNA polymerase sigma factor [Bacteroidales bacterium]HPS62648.1 RNA polymerase sigma factor [Bacteroidales bacterium]
MIRQPDIVEEDLIRKASAGDNSAIEALYDRYAPILLSVCYRYCGNRDDAEDILHDGFIKIIRNIAKFEIRREGSAEAWMKRIMVNTALNFIRERGKWKNLLENDSINDIEEPADESDETGADRYPDLRPEEVMQLVCALPPGYRTVFNLYVFEQYGHREIANLLGCTENTSKSQLSKARGLLRKKISQMISTNTSRAYEKV